MTLLLLGPFWPASSQGAANARMAMDHEEIRKPAAYAKALFGEGIGIGVVLDLYRRDTLQFRANA